MIYMIVLMLIMPAMTLAQNVDDCDGEVIMYCDDDDDDDGGNANDD